MKKIFALTILTLLAITTSTAQLANGKIQIDDLWVEGAGETVNIKFAATIAPKAVKRNHSLVFIPVIAGEGYKQSLSPVVIHGSGSRVARERREWVAGQLAQYDDAIYAKNGETIILRASFPFQQWMREANLIFEGVEGGCCFYNKFSDLLYAQHILAEMKPEPVVAVVEAIQEPEQEWVPVSVADSLSTAFTFVLPASEYNEKEPFKVYDNERESSMIVYYRVNKYNIDPSYMDNTHTLENLTAVINMIMGSKDSKVEKIVVGGFASPEGIFELNDRLAFERAVSVKRYLMETTGIDDHRISVFNGSEDWYGLRAMVSRSNLPDKQKILSIIDTIPIWDSKRNIGRQGELMRLNGGRTYQHLLKEYFPYLRSGAFIKVYYQNTPPPR